MSKRITEDREWERRKEQIHHLYVSEKRTLTEVMSLMRAQGFTRSKSQYERVLSKWGFSKNLSATQWRSIRYHIDKRHTQGKQSDVWIYGALTDRTLVRQRIARHDNQSTFQRHRDHHRLVRSPVLPAEIMVRTPSPVPMEVVVRTPDPTWHIGSREQSPRQLLTKEGSNPLPKAVPLVTLDCDFLARCGETTPWHNYTAFMKSLEEILPRNVIITQSILDQVTTLPCTLDVPEDVEVLLLQTCSKLQAWFDDLNGLLYLQLEDYATDMADFRALSRFHDAPASFLPPTINEWSQINLYNASDLTRRDSQLEFLKLIVLLLSNNAHVPQLKGALVELAHVEQNRLLLQKLLSQRLWSVVAFAEKLLPSTAQAGDLQLLTVLHRGGADLNAKPQMLECTPLMHAIDQDHEHIVKYLLENGAKCYEVSRTPKNIFRLHNVSMAPSVMPPLDYAVWVGNLAMVKLFFSIKCNIYQAPHIDTATLYIAVKLERYDILEYLLYERSDLIDEFAQHTCILGVAAVSTGSVKMLNTLVGYGLDVKKAVECGCGDVPLEAAYRGKEDLLLELIRLGFNPSSTHKEVTCWTISEDPADDRPPILIESPYYGFSPLQISVMNGSEHISEILITHGADVNQVCRGMTPLQLGVACENEQMIRLLIEHGADINLCCDIDDGGIDYGKPRYITRRHDEFGSRKTYEMLNYYADFLPKNVFDGNIHHRAGRSALQIAMEVGNEVMFRFLMASGAKIPEKALWDPWESAFRGRNEYIIRYMENESQMHPRTASALEACIRSCGTDMAKRLASRGIFQFDVDFQHQGPLSAAIEHNDIYFIDFILSKIHKDNIRSVGLAGMFTAVLFDRTDAIDRLIKIGLEPLDSKQYGSKTILDWADIEWKLKLWDHSLKAVTMLSNALVQRNTITEEEEKIKRTALIHVLHRAAEYGNRLSIVQLALNAGVDMNSTTSMSPAPAIQRAMANDSHIIASYLIAKGAAVNPPAIEATRDWLRIRFDTPLQAAAMSSRYNLCEAMLQKGANVNASPTRGGATAIQSAAINGDFRILALLLSHGGDVNAAPAPDNGRYAIEGAAEQGRLDMVRFLVACGANVRGKTNIIYRRTVFRAWEEGHRALVRMIQDFKAREYGPDDIEDIEVIMSSMSEDELLYTSQREKDACQRLEELQVRNRERPGLEKSFSDPCREPILLRWEDFMNGASAHDVDTIIF